jgi:hypothetical protein
VKLVPHADQFGKDSQAGYLSLFYLNADAHWRRDWLPGLKAHHSELFALSATTNEVWSTEWVDGPMLLYPNLSALVKRLMVRWESGIFRTGSINVADLTEVRPSDADLAAAQSILGLTL